MKYIILWLVILISPVSVFSQLSKLNKGVRTSFGISNFHDQVLKDTFSFTPGFSIGLVLEDSIKRNFKIRVELGYAQKGAKQKLTDKSINLNYISAILLFGKYFPTTNTCIFAGVYEGYLINPQFEMDYYYGHYYSFNVLDFGLMFRPSQVIFKNNVLTLAMDAETSYSITSVYDNSKQHLTTPESAWTRNLTFSLGVNLIF